MIRALYTEPDGRSLLLRKCGVDHPAPAVDVWLTANRFWTENFRNQQTRRYIAEVESATPACEVEIEFDIKPGGDPNSIKWNNPYGVITVAILTAGCFDATTVDHTTVAFEGAGERHVDNRTSLARRHEEDVNGDRRSTRASSRKAALELVGGLTCSAAHPAASYKLGVAAADPGGVNSPARNSATVNASLLVKRGSLHDRTDYAGNLLRLRLTVVLSQYRAY